jgi:hypothetical protein
MSDSHLRYRTIRTALEQLFPKDLNGHQRRHLTVLAALMSGIVGSRSSQLPAIASKVPGSAQRESRIKQYARWVQNPQVCPEVFFLPFAQALLVHLSSNQSLVLVMDGSEIGRRCAVLLVSVLFHHRALPVAWLTVGGRGHGGQLTEAVHLELLGQVQALLPPGADVVFLGDGEFDGPQLQAQLNRYHWEYVCRTAKNTCLEVDGERVSFQELGLQPGECRGLPQAHFSEQRYGPVLGIAWWAKGYTEPIFLVSNLDLVAEACHWYAKRFSIETFFSDQKSRGFRLDKSHLADPQRLSRLLMAAFLAYIWIVYLGTLAQQDPWIGLLHRTDRCDLSLFQLGLSFLDYLLTEERPIPVSFQMPEPNCVR